MGCDIRPVNVTLHCLPSATMLSIKYMIVTSNLLWMGMSGTAVLHMMHGLVWEFTHITFRHYATVTGQREKRLHSTVIQPTHSYSNTDVEG
jgi:hypothetical protein